MANTLYDRSGNKYSIAVRMLQSLLKFATKSQSVACSYCLRHGNNWLNHLCCVYFVGKFVMIIADTPEKIELMRWLTLRSALKLEIAGMKRRGQSAHSILKSMGYTGSKAKILEQMDREIKEQKGVTIH